MTTPLSRTFLSYARHGLAAQIETPASEASALPARATIPVGIQVNSRAPVGLSLQTYGPGDVIGFDEGQIARVEPAPGSTNFESDLLACVEFARPDLPWVLTPAAPDPANGRIRPWLALIVVTQQDSAVTAVPGIPLPVLTCPLAGLPDLTESWAWAHAQVTGAPGTGVDALLASPGSSSSRLICPRHLMPTTAYFACVVPAFEAGVLAGLGQPVPAGNLSPAWGPGSASTIRLPVYFQWAFATGPSGDFATLAGQLRPRIIQADIGIRDVDISAADPEIPASDAASGVIGMSAATGGGSSADVVPAAFQTALETVLAGGATGVGPPVYGGLQAGTGAKLPPAGTPPQWLRDLNLDPRHRSAAGLGVQVVQNAQEQLMAAAWQQAAQLAQANQLLQNGQLARSVSAAWYRKHLPSPVDAGSADRLMQLTGPAHDRIRPPTATQTIAGQVSISAPMTAAIAIPYRRVARALGPLARRLGAGAASPLVPPLSAITAGRLVTTPPPPAPAGMVSLDGIAAGPGTGPQLVAAAGSVPAAVTYRGITPQLVSGSAPWWQGSAGGFAAPAAGYWSDLVVFRATTTGLAWRVGQRLSFAGQAAAGWQAEQSLVTSHSSPPQVVAATIFAATGPVPVGPGPVGPGPVGPGPVGPPAPADSPAPPGTGITVPASPTPASPLGNPVPAIAAITIDPPTVPRSFQLHIGSAVAPAGGVSSWAQPTPIGAPISAPVLGADLLIANLSGPSAPDLLLIWVEQESAGAQAAKYEVATGVGSPLPTGTTTAPATLPFTPTGDFGIAGATVGAAAPNTLDVLVWWMTGSPGARTGRYVIGWQFGVNGPKSWSAPLSVPGPLPDAAVGLGAALTDISSNGRPDLLLYYIEQVPAAPASPQPAPAFQGRYLIGWDLDATGVPAGGWSPTFDIPGNWAGTGFGGSATIASLDSTRLAEIAAMGAAFQSQASSLQRELLAPVTLPAPPPVPPPFTSAALASTVRGALDPGATVPARLLPQIQVGSAQMAPPASADPLAVLALTPSFPQPMYRPLRDLAAGMVLPSTQDVPPDTVTLLQADPAFIESYFAGLNHEMSRLLAWRGYPADGTGTYFQYFWDRPAGSASGPDIPPISAWNSAAPLGGHATSVGAAGMLMLLIRGALPARWPGLIVRASRAAFASAVGTQKNPTDVWLDPVFSGRLEPDISFYGFALTAARARSSGTTLPGPRRDPGWFFVLSEQPFQPRFGLEPLPQPPVYGGAPATWTSLNWGELAPDATSYAALSQISAASPPAPLKGLTLNNVTFGFNAAHMAAITLRQPFQVAIHADEMLQGL